MLALGRKGGRDPPKGSRSQEAGCDGSLNQDNGPGEGGSWADLRYALECKTHLADGSWMGRGIIKDACALWLDWPSRCIAIDQVWKNRAKGFRKSQFSMGHTTLKIPMSHPRGNIKSSDCYLRLELKGEVGLETES